MAKKNDMTPEESAELHVDHNSLLDDLLNIGQGKSPTSAKTLKKKASKEIGGILQPQDISLMDDEFADSMDKLFKIGMKAGGNKYVSAGSANKTGSVKTTSSQKIDDTLMTAIYEEIKDFHITSENDIQIIREALKESLKTARVQRIIKNTKSIGKSAQKFFTTKTGMKIEYNVLGQTINMYVDGDFTGNEHFAINPDGNDIQAMVFEKNEDGSLSNISDNYRIMAKKA